MRIMYGHCSISKGTSLEYLTPQFFRITDPCLTVFPARCGCAITINSYINKNA